MTDPLAVLVGCVLLVVVLLVVASCLLRANRLDRLHVRTDAARAALLAALERRAVVARAVARQRGDGELRALAARTERVPSADREAAENALSERLASVDRAGLPDELRVELADAEQRVMLARRVYNDAVRDTLALRSRRLVRWLRLAGTAPAPEYFEIVDPEPDLRDASVVAPPRRRAGRVLLLDAEGRVLLFEGIDPARPQEPFWFTPGGAVEPGEDTRTAAARELAEETGVRVPAERLVGPVWRRTAVFSFGGRTVTADEDFFLLSGHGGAIDTSGFSGIEAATTLGHRWWTDEELRTTDLVIYPRQLGELVARVRQENWDPRADSEGPPSERRADSAGEQSNASPDRCADDLHLTES